MLDLIGFAGQYGFSGGYVSILGSANNYNALLRTGATASIVSMTSPDNLQVTFGHSKTFIAGVKIASAQDGSGRSLVGGGGSVASDIEHLAIANVYFGRGDGDWNRFSGYFRRLTVWNKRLLNARLQTLTDPDDPAVYPALDAVVDLDFEHGCYFFSDLEDAADGSGRQIKTAACTGSASATATATDWALVDSVNQRLLANGKLDEPVDKVSGQAFEMPSLILQLPSH